MVVGHRHRQVLFVDQAVSAGAHELRGPAPQRILRDVVVVADDRDVAAIRTAHDDRADRLARLDPVRSLVLDLLRVRVDVAVALVARGGVLARGIAHPVGPVDDRGAGPDLAVGMRSRSGQRVHQRRDDSDPPPARYAIEATSGADRRRRLVIVPT